MGKIRSMGITIIVLLSIIALSGCTESGTKFNVVVIFATGGLGDKSFNDAGYRGLLAAEEKYGSNLTMTYVEPETIPEFATYQNDLAAKGKYDKRLL